MSWLKIISTIARTVVVAAAAAVAAVAMIVKATVAAMTVIVVMKKKKINFAHLIMKTTLVARLLVKTAATQVTAVLIANKN